MKTADTEAHGWHLKPYAPKLPPITVAVWWKFLFHLFMVTKCGPNVLFPTNFLRFFLHVRGQTVSHSQMQNKNTDTIQLLPNRTLFSPQLGLDEYNMNIVYHEYMMSIYHEYQGYNISYEYQYPGLDILSMNITNRRGDKGHSCLSPMPVLIVLDSMPRRAVSNAQSVQGINESSLPAPPTEYDGRRDRKCFQIVF